MQIESEFTVREQYLRIIYLGLAFMVMFTSFNSLQNMVSKLYDEYHFDNLGQTAVLFIYFSFSIGTFFTSFVIKTFGYRKTMLLSSLGYALFEATGFVVVTRVEIPVALVWVIIIAGAIVCGFSASILWVAQGAYTSQVASENRKSELFGLFWGLMMSSQIFGNLLITLVLGHINNLVYFIILVCLGSIVLPNLAGSAFLFLMLPSVSKDHPDIEETTIKQEVKMIWTIVKNKDNIFFNLYCLFPGLTIAFYAGFMYKLIRLAIVQEPNESIDTYNKRLNEAQGLMFITLGCCQLLTGILMNRFAQPFCKFKLAIVGTIIVEIAGFTSFICYFKPNQTLCFICSGLWGVSQTFLQTNTSALVSKIFPGKVQGFSVYRIFFAIGVVFINILIIALGDTPAYIFLSIVMLIQALSTGVAFNLKDLDRSEKKDSLISRENDGGSGELDISGSKKE